jgi:hypothetical protein
MVKPFMALLALTFAPVPSAWATTCDFADYSANLFRRGACRSDLADTTETFVVEGTRVVLDYGDHQGRFHRWRLNGKAASAYEFNRDAYCGWTDDLTQSFCFAIEGPVPW